MLERRLAIHDELPKFLMPWRSRKLGWLYQWRLNIDRCSYVKEVCRDGVNSQRCMMTEQLVNNESSNQNLNVPTSGNTPVVTNTVTPKVYTEEEVNRIAGTKKQDGYQKGYDAAKAEWLQQATAQPHQQNFTPAQNNVAPINPVNQPQSGLTVEQARAIAKEELQTTLQAQNYQALANNFVSKVEANKSKFSDFDTVVTPLNLPQIPEIWMTAAQFEDPATIMYHLGKNPGKLAELRNLSYSSELVKRAMREIHDSAKQNEDAEKARVAQAPLSRQKPSTVGVDSGKDKSEFSVQDWKKILRK